MKKTEEPLLKDGSGLFRQLAAATRHGLALHEVVAILAQEADAPAGGPAFLAQLQAQLAQGRPLSGAMQAAPGAFAPETIQWVRQAERDGEPGTLAATLDALAEDMEQRRLGADSLRLALLWPSCLLVGVALLFSVLAVFVVPAFDELFANLGAELPSVTRLAFSMMGAWWLWMPPAAVALALLVGHLAGWLPGGVAQSVDRAVHRVGLGRRVRAAAFKSRLLDMLRQRGDAPLHAAALAHLAATTPTPALAAAAARLQAAAQSGARLSDALAAERLLPRRLSLHMLLGEKMGDPQAALAPLWATARQEHQEALVRFERAAVVSTYLAIGAVVGLLVVATYLPIFMLGTIA